MDHFLTCLLLCSALARLEQARQGTDGSCHDLLCSPLGLLESPGGCSELLRNGLLSLMVSQPPKVNFLESFVCGAASGLNAEEENVMFSCFQTQLVNSVIGK